MPKQAVVTDNAPRPGGAYSQAIRAGDFVYISGQGGLDPATRALAGDDIEAQTEQTLKNVRALLEAAGASMSDVVKSTVHLNDLSLFPRFNAVYAQHFPDPKPVRTTVGSQLLGGMLVEIDVVAYTGG
ncbi:MAG: RidA family protein [Anaerolineae bacterium]|nr:RidA family protein [Anaerolineae bacterium]